MHSLPISSGHRRGHSMIQTVDASRHGIRLHTVPTCEVPLLLHHVAFTSGDSRFHAVCALPVSLTRSHNSLVAFSHPFTSAEPSKCLIHSSQLLYPENASGVIRGHGGPVLVLAAPASVGCVAGVPPSPPSVLMVLSVGRDPADYAKCDELTWITEVNILSQ